jgi:hypothetical protein
VGGLEVRVIQEQGGSDEKPGSPFVFIPREAFDVLGLKRGDRVIVILNSEAKRVEIYPENIIKERAGLPSEQ